MPTTRTRRPRWRAADAITHEVAQAWLAGDFHALNRALGVMPWQISPFNAHREHVGASELLLSSLPRARELRAALLEVAGEPGDMDRHGRPLGPGLPSYRDGDDD